MDARKIKQRVEDALDLLPTTFTVQNALRTMRMSKDQCRRVRAALDELVDAGQLFHSVATGKQLGRKPTTWSKSQREDGRERLREAVRSVLPELPAEFTMQDVLARLRMSVRMESRVRPVLDQLVRDVVIVSVSTLRRGRNSLMDQWSAHPEKIAAEMDWQRKRAAIESREDNRSRLERLAVPWDPFGERSAGNG